MGAMHSMFRHTGVEDNKLDRECKFYCVIDNEHEHV